MYPPHERRDVPEPAPAGGVRGDHPGRGRVGRDAQHALPVFVPRVKIAQQRPRARNRVPHANPSVSVRDAQHHGGQLELAEVVHGGPRRAAALDEVQTLRRVGRRDGGVAL